MCVIATAAKKRHITREEVLECMRINSDGFFMAALRPNGTRASIRTLDHDEAIRFFDESVKDDDAFVMHARIPSRGEKTLENVHGWEIDRIMFMHNMTITEVDAMMKRVKWDKTDSEFFFRKVFIPFYRGLGAEAYKDGKFHEDLDNIIQHFVGYNNKFCFIMPDNKVIRYGNWVSEPTRRENGEIAFYASNASYKVVSYGTNSGRGGTAGSTAGFCSKTAGYGGYGYGGYGYGGYDDDFDPYGYDEFKFQGAYGGDYFKGTGKSGKKPAGTKKSRIKSANIMATTAKPYTAFQGKMLFNMAGVKGVCELALSHMVIENTLACRYIYSENETENQVEKIVRTLLPQCFVGTYDRIKAAFKELVEADDLGIGVDAVKKYVERFAEAAAKVYEEPICKVQAPYSQAPQEWSIRLGLKPTVDRINSLLRILNININFDQHEPDGTFVSGYVLAKDGSMMEEFLLEDLIGIDDVAVDSSPDGIQMILSVINNCVEEFYGAADEVLPLAEAPAATETAEPEANEPSDEDTGLVLTGDDDHSNEPATADPGTESGETDTAITSEDKSDDSPDGNDAA